MLWKSIATTNKIVLASKHTGLWCVCQNGLDMALSSVPCLFLFPVCYVRAIKIYCCCGHSLINCSPSHAWRVRFICKEIFAVTWGLKKPQSHPLYFCTCYHYLLLRAFNSYQVWSLPQFYSVDFPKSRIDGKKCVLNNQDLHQLLLTVSWDLRV